MGRRAGLASVAIGCRARFASSQCASGYPATCNQTGSPLAILRRIGGKGIAPRLHGRTHLQPYGARFRPVLRFQGLTLLQVLQRPYTTSIWGAGGDRCKPLATIRLSPHGCRISIPAEKPVCWDLLVTEGSHLLIFQESTSARGQSDYPQLAISAPQY